jgi:predicted RNase H-like HicB family nuclease
VRKKSKNHIFTVLIEQDEDNFYVATVPSLKSCYTQARTLEKLYPRIKEVIELCIEEEKPKPMKFVALQQLELAV